MNKKMFYVFGSGFGGGLVGFSANRLDTTFGIITSTIGIFLMVFCIIKANK